MHTAVATAEPQGSTELVLFETIKCPPAVVLFQTGGEDEIDRIIDKIAAEVKAEHYDVSTAKGRERCRSRAASVTRSKTLLDGMGKELGEEHHRIWKGIAARRKRAWDRLEALAAETRQPLTEWEEAEKARIDHVEKTIGFFKQSAAPAMGTVLGEMKNMRDAVRAVDVTEDVFRADYQRALQIREHADTQLTTFIDAEERRIEDARRAEEERIERERLAAEAEKRREEEAAAERQRLEDERRKIEAEREAERARIEAERAEELRQHQAEIARQREEAEEAARVERERLAAEQAKRDAEIAEERRKHREALEAAERREQERMAALQAEADEARRKLAEAEARERERQRIEDEERAAIAAQARAAVADEGARTQAAEPDLLSAEQHDEERDAFVDARRAAVAALCDQTGLSNGDAEWVVNAIAAGTIPHLRFEPGANVG